MKKKTKIIIGVSAAIVVAGYFIRMGLGYSQYLTNVNNGDTITSNGVTTPIKVKWNGWNWV